MVKLPHPWLKSVKRRNQRSFPPITRSEFVTYLDKARATRYVRQPELAMRDASLLAFEFLFKTRVSEAVGRVYPESSRADMTLESVSFRDVCEGVKVDDFKTSMVKGRDVLRVRFRVLNARATHETNMHVKLTLNSRSQLLVNVRKINGENCVG